MGVTAEKETADFEVSSAEPEVETEGSQEFEELGHEFVKDDSGVEEPEEGTQEVPAVAEEVAEKTPETPEAEVKTEVEVLTPVETPEEEKKPEESQKTETEKETATTKPEEGQEDYQAWRERTQTELANLYSFTDEEAEAFTEDPVKALPTLVAKAHLNVFESLIQSLGAQLPNAVQEVVLRMEAGKTSEEAFYSMWPKLKSPEHQDTVFRMTQAYRRANPAASLEQAIREVGAAAMVALRIPFEESVKPVAPVALPPHQPMAATPARVAPRATSNNEFEQISEELLQDDNI